jgi:site-specific DNA-methyltransferase (adenine-specific)
LLSCEQLERKCITTDVDPVFCEITIRRLERYRSEGKSGWQNSNPFYEEIVNDKKLRNYLSEKYEIKIIKEKVIG